MDNCGPVVGRFRRNLVGTADRLGINSRATQLGESWVMNVFPDLNAAVAEGSLFVGTGAFAVGVAGPNQATFLNTSSILTLANKDTADGSSPVKEIFPVWLRLIVVATGTGTTSMDVGGVLDAGLRGSAGTPIALAASAGAIAEGSITDARFTPTTAAPGPLARNAGRAKIKTAALAAGDEFFLRFAAPDLGASFPLATSGRLVVPMPGVSIPPGMSYTLHAWFTGVTVAPTFEFELCVIER